MCVHAAPLTRAQCLYLRAFFDFPSCVLPKALSQPPFSRPRTSRHTPLPNVPLHAFLLPPRTPSSYPHVHVFLMSLHSARPPHIPAQVIPYLTVYAVLPSSLVFLLAYSFASQRLTRG